MDVLEHIPPTRIRRTRVSAAFDEPAHIARERLVSSDGLEKGMSGFFKVVDRRFGKGESHVGGRLDVAVFVEQERDQGVSLSVFLYFRGGEQSADLAN